MNDDKPALFITPPFTQLNTPYPATAFLKGFLNTKNIKSTQVDLGLEVILSVFSRDGLTRLFDGIDPGDPKLTDNFRRILTLRHEYISTIGNVISFLQDKDPAIAHLICGREWLPEASRFGGMADLEMAFGDLGIRDKARHLATLYLEDIGDLITGMVDPHFGFSRYAERLGRSPATFDELEQELNKPESFFDHYLIGLLQEKTDLVQPGLVAITIPFPGNLYSALKCGQWLKKNRPQIPVAFGGGYIGTELRSLSDPRVFNMTDFILLDDGETPLINLLEYLRGKRKKEELKRTFLRDDGMVVFCNGSTSPDCLPGDSGTPDYSDLPLDRYLPVIEIANPMHRLWSDGRWNRLILAHGCYWAKCAFCDTTLDYIHRYVPNKPAQICDRMEAIMAQTGKNGFHFVDEAAPPALLREVALEVIRRDLNVCWWTNIRFETNFTSDLCRLLKASGCIAVSGGLEVASDRILKMIDKGVSVSQAVRVARNFTEAGIMVHTYLMYGFPTQTARETIDSLEIVRQLFFHGLVQSGFWHLFAMTAHSKVGKHPEAFGVVRKSFDIAPFANNDLSHHDPLGCDHEAFGEGLRKALYNYMHGICIDRPLQEWFDFPIPPATIAPKFVAGLLKAERSQPVNPDAHVLWLGGPCSIRVYQRKKKGKIHPWATVVIHNRRENITLSGPSNLGQWLYDRLPSLSARNRKIFTFKELEQDFSRHIPIGFESFRKGPVMHALRDNGLILL